MQETEQNAYYSGETWVAGKAEPISTRVAAPLGEPMLRGNIALLTDVSRQPGAGHLTGETIISS